MTTTIDFRERSEIAHATSCDVEELLERSLEVDALADVLASVTDTGRGRLVLVAGEAGIGKTALVRAFCSGLGRVRVLSGACDALFTPRPLGPLLDIAEETGGELAELVEGGAGPSDVLTALLRRAARRTRRPSSCSRTCTGPTRRRSTCSACSRAGSRRCPRSSSHVPRRRARPRPSAAVALGELRRSGASTRLALAPLSPTAVAALARPYGADRGRAAPE